MTDFDRALEFVVHHEGGYVDHPDDPGGETNMGITARTARAHGYTGTMRELPRVVAEEIYRLQYWRAVRGDDLPWPLCLAVFDGAVNSGVRQSARWLQRAVVAHDDGVIGPLTLAAVDAAVEASGAVDVARWHLDLRLEFLRALAHWPTFGRGWQRRIDDLRARCVA